MTLTARERAKVNAALLELRAGGADADAVIRIAEAKLKTGTPTKQAYEYAFDRFATENPNWSAPLQRIGQLIDASDNRTVASYNVAMARYIETGDRAHIEAIAPTVTQDMAEMARRTGDAGFADALPQAPAQEATAPPPAEPTSRPGWGPMGFQPGSTNADPAPAAPATNQ